MGLVVVEPYASTYVVEALWQLKNLLVTSCGWTVPSCSDGTTYSSSGDIIDDHTDLFAIYSWFRLQAPDGREFLFQRSADPRDWRVMYSRGAGFVGGAPSATQTPSATDEALIRGGGSHATPTYERLFLSTNGNLGVGVVAQDSAPHGFCLFTRQSAGTGGSDGTILYDPMPTEIDGDDPYVIYCPVDPSTAAYRDAAAFGINTMHVDHGPRAWSAIGTPDEAFGVVPASHQGSTNSAGGFYSWFSVNIEGAGDPPIDGRHALLPVFYGRAAGSGAKGFKGRSTMLRWLGESHTIGATYEDKSGQKWLNLSNQMVVAWGGLNAALHEFATDWSGGGGGDSNTPVIANFTPTPGSVIATNTQLEFDVTDETYLAAIAVFASYPDGSSEIVFDGENFRGAFTGSRRNAVTGGYRFSVRRSGGWQASPTLEYLALDGRGNKGVIA